MDRMSVSSSVPLQLKPSARASSASGGIPIAPVGKPRRAQEPSQTLIKHVSLVRRAACQDAPSEGIKVIRGQAGRLHNPQQRGMQMMRVLSLLSIATLFAACSDTSGPSGPPDVTMVSMDNPVKYVANALTVPMDRMQFGMDLNGDGKTDNQLGNIIGALSANN